jgi:3-isopropylmalate/(R)-2-methylmalate dehydratase small subunit
VIAEIFDRFAGRETYLKTDWDNTSFELVAGSDVLTVPFRLSAFERALVEAGGWLEYADGRY